MYADDLILISASILDLQSMLHICNDVAVTLGIKFNGTKSHCIYIGPKVLQNLPSMSIGSQNVFWAKQIKYLGIYINSYKHFNVDLTECRRKFFISLNCILSKTKFACDLVKLKLIESYCLSSLLYCVEAGILDNNQVKLMNSWFNSIYRKIFGYFKWESVREIIGCLDKLNFTYMENLRRIQFIKNIICNAKDMCNVTLLSITKHFMHSNEFQCVCNKCTIDFNCPFPMIKSAVHNAFKLSC
jgi:hypothetical protein